MSNYIAAEYEKVSIDQRFFAYKHQYLKVVYNLKLDNEDKYYNPRIISKVFKLDENNQYGYTMTKPLPTGCIKEKPPCTWKEFNILLKKVSPEDKIDHLFVVNIEFNYKKATQ